MILPLSLVVTLRPTRRLPRALGLAAHLVVATQEQSREPLTEGSHDELRDHDAFFIYDRSGLFEHLAGTLMMNPESDILHDVKCSLLDFRNLILGQNPQMYGPFLYGT